MEKKHTTKMKVGKVVSSAMDKSIVVMVERTVHEPHFGKYIRRRNKFMAHDEKNECRIGDTVQIRECRPISKRKRWRLDEVITKTTGVE